MKPEEAVKVPSAIQEARLQRDHLYYFLASGACILIVAALFVVFNGGLRIGFSNHTGLLPVVRRILDPSYLPNDFGIQLRLYHHRVFAYLVAGFSKVLGEDNALIALGSVGAFLLSAALFSLCRSLKLTIFAFLTVGTFVALKAAFVGRGLEFNTFLGTGEIQPPAFSHAFFLFGVAALVKERFALAAAFAGLALLFHLQIGVGLILILVPFYALRGRAVGLRVILVCLAIFLVFVALVLPDLSQMISRGLLKLPLTRAYIDFRQPHHFELASGQAAFWVFGYLCLQLVAWLWLRRNKKEREPGVFVLFALSLLIAGISVIHFADYYFGQNNQISKLQFVRLSRLITVFGIISLVVLVNALPSSSWHRTGLNLGMIACGVLFYSVTAVRNGADFAIRISKYADQKSDWVDTCLWVKANLPASALVLTPPGEDGFVYLAGRSNIGDFKTNPDGSQFLAEWYQRLRDLTGGKLPQEKGFANLPLVDQAYARLTSGELLELSKKYKADFAVLPKNSIAPFTTLYENGGFKVARLSGNKLVSSASAPSSSIEAAGVKSKKIFQPGDPVLLDDGGVGNKD